MNSLPDAQYLKKLRDSGLTYSQIAAIYDVDHSTIWRRLDRAGLLKHCRPYLSRNNQRNEINFQTRASTALVLIRDGRNSYRELAEGLGYRTVSAVESLVAWLLSNGFVKKDNGKNRTLRLTALGRKSVPLIQLARRRPDGVLESC